MLLGPGGQATLATHWPGLRDAFDGGPLCEKEQGAHCLQREWRQTCPQASQPWPGHGGRGIRSPPWTFPVVKSKLRGHGGVGRGRCPWDGCGPWRSREAPPGPVCVWGVRDCGSHDIGRPMARAMFSLTEAGTWTLSYVGEETPPWWPPRAHPGPFRTRRHRRLAGGRSCPALTCFPSARFLLPSAQLSETLANFLAAQVAVETDGKKGPGQSQPQAGEITGCREIALPGRLGLSPHGLSTGNPTEEKSPCVHRHRVLARVPSRPRAPMLRPTRP